MSLQDEKSNPHQGLVNFQHAFLILAAHFSIFPGGTETYLRLSCSWFKKKLNSAKMILYHPTLETSLRKEVQKIVGSQLLP